MNKIKKHSRALLALLLALQLVTAHGAGLVEANAAGASGIKLRIPQLSGPRSVAVYGSKTGQFGDGLDDDLHIGAGQTITLPVAIPHVSVVEMNYRNITIEAGGTLRCSDPNAGLVLKATGNVVINGIIDQSGMAPKSNPGNAYPYPAELVCGAGGKGGSTDVSGGRGMSSRRYGGGYGGGGAGTKGNWQPKPGRNGATGGNSDDITIDVPTVFVGGAGGVDDGNNIYSPAAGRYGGGGGGEGTYDDDDKAKVLGGAGATGAGASGQDGNSRGLYIWGGSGGGAGNMGGGAVMLYIAGTGTITGAIDCRGLPGGKGGKVENYGVADAGGGGGGGGGAIYIEYRSTAPTITGTLSVSGGAGGTSLTSARNGSSGGNGTSTIKRTPDFTPPVVHSVTTPSEWGQTNTATVIASDSETGVVSYAISTGNSAPSSGWQPGNTFTLDANGTHYAWVKDGVGNISAGYIFVVSRVDTEIPVINSVSVAPAGWTNSVNKTITVVAGDSQSMVAQYGISTTMSVPTSWQNENTFQKPSDTYYVWVKDHAGRISLFKQVVVDQMDSIVPIISSVTVPSGWGQTSVVTIHATDSGGSGIARYAVSDSSATPGNGWQSDPDFILSTNGGYYAFVKDNAGNITPGKTFSVSKVDQIKPSITSTTVTPSGWVNEANKTITVSATDAQSGITGYGITTTTSVPTTWQGSNLFLKPNGAYYVWAKDDSGLISDPWPVTVSGVDTDKPVIDSVEIPADWAQSSSVIIHATDSGGSGIAGYAVSDSSATPGKGWQTDPDFTLSTNGGYYAFVKDNAGNITSGKYFLISKVDTIKPAVSSVLVDEQWAFTVPVSIYANDTGSGVAAYAYSKENQPPSEGWQSTSNFGITKNGDYFAFVRDKAGNVSNGKAFAVRTVDREKPIVTDVVVTDDWATDSRVKLSADDMGSGIAGYAVSDSSAIPGGGWKTSTSFTLTANGSYYAWARDKAGNISESFTFVVGKVDTEKPTVKKANVSLGWSSISAVDIDADDIGSGVKEYVVSSYSYAPSTGWQSSPSFTLDKNGTFYAFVRDFAGNLSASFRFEVSQVDLEKPMVTKVNIPLGWSSVSEIELEASDVGSGIADYAVTGDFAPPTDGWQNSASFTLDKNGSYYAWVKDLVGNISEGKFFSISKVDRVPPSIGSIGYNTDYTILMIRGKDNASGVKQIYLDGVPYEGGTVSWDVPAGTRYVKIQVEDVAGNRSEEVTERIPGWFDVLDSLFILPVEFIDENKKAVITAESSSDSEILGIFVNGKFAPGNPVTYPVSAGMEYLELQAQNTVGDRSAVYRVRVPGWSQESNTISIVDVRFSQDSSTAQITAMETGGKGIKGIRVNGELLPGNPVTYSIPEGTKHLEMQAEDNDGDRSAKLIRRVPGWSQVVTTLSISDVTFLDYNTTAQITATATGGDSVSGIEVNGQLMEGNPVVYTVPKGTTLLHIQAINPVGDRSPMVNKTVPQDSSKSTLKIGIKDPGWTKSRTAKIRLEVTDVNRITKVLVRTSEDREWRDVTEQRYVVIDQDTTVYASVENDKGEIKEASQSIECFDTVDPRVTATQDGKSINIRATDDRSGVVSILVNNKEYQQGDFEDGKLTWRIPAGTTLVTIKAEDAAGNLSRQLELPIQNTTTAVPVIVTPTPAPPSTPEPPPTEGALPAPPDEPTAEPEAEPVEPKPVETVLEPMPQPVSPAVQTAAAVGTVGASAAGGLWYWLRKKRLDKPIEELDTDGKKRLYDESEYGGPIDPLDKKEGDKKC